ncbi:uncharacterized protein BP5553_06213 [Venustampulla echinocandica]|uniref:Golgi apparatus membrane protein TVP38 n=1 Tax=Venustampulla echinocandica TaxID=2656787 RepID=A0A370TMW7_9HELO|nr:uncharacterized protein BP5553_06213 [Venustampulla echinocandica]RDL36861.1 hypothetical protein BP5553_06213 [Venustampulla echinocandica]
MPADYSSTARALALPISPIPSPSPESENTRPAWTRRISTSTRRSPYSQPSRVHISLQSQIIDNGYKIQRRLLKIFQSLSLLQQILTVLVSLTCFVLSILFLVYNERIFHAFAPVAVKWKAMTGGWMILWALTFIAAFPPLIGYSSAVTISGFVYGFPAGWYIVSTATVAGSLASFISSRTIFSSYVHRLVGQDKRFEALALTLKHDGIKILVMIRLCPLPYSLSNAAMSTFPTVHPLSFALATALSTPKLLIHVFIGSRLAIIAENGGTMGAGTKAINYISIIFGAIMGAAVGYIIYNRTIARAKELEIEEMEAGRRESSASAGGERGYNDADESDAAALMDGDDISLWDNEDGCENRGAGYRDEFTDDDEDVFASGDQDEPAKKGRGKHLDAL